MLNSVHSHYFTKFLVFIIGLALFMVAVNAQAHRHILNHEQALELNAAGKILPAQDILNLALAAKPNAQLLEMQLRQFENNYYYRLKLATDNQEIHRLVYDASNGQLVKERSHQFMQRQHPGRHSMQHKNRSEHKKHWQEKRQQSPKKHQPAE